MNPLTDTDSMPFGKYKGMPMQDVPVSYLHYLWTDCHFDLIPKSKNPAITEHQVRSVAVANYIKENMEALKMEAPDRIW